MPAFLVNFASATYSGVTMNLHIFNPESDLALAYGLEGYTAPPHVARLRRDMQMLPAWYCAKGDAILSQDCPADSEWLAQVRSRLGVEAVCMPANQLQNHRLSVIPWGWSRDLLHRLKGWNVAEECLPDRRQIDQIRRLSHRSTAVRLLRHISREVDMELPPEPFEARSLDEVLDFERAHRRCYVKAPWSGSGRGVYQALDTGSPNFLDWTRGIIKRQGSVMCEHALDKVMDFAMEFRCRGGAAVEFAGHSVFTTDSHDSFESGVVAPDEALRSMIAGRLGDGAPLDRVKEAVAGFVAAEIAPHYRGYLGVDMMLYRGAGGVRLNPCVEINLRMTMGAVAAIFARRHLAEGSAGALTVRYHKQGIPAQARTEAGQELEIAGGRIVSGALPLVPSYPGSRYTAQIRVAAGSAADLWRRLISG